MYLVSGLTRTLILSKGEKLINTGIQVEKRSASNTEARGIGRACADSWGAPRLQNQPYPSAKTFPVACRHYSVGNPPGRGSTDYAAPRRGQVVDRG